MNVITTGWACSDCTMLIANGETPAEMDETQTAAWLAEIDRRADGGYWVNGGEHDSDCDNLDDEGNWVGTSDCDCERIEFTWSSCDVCGSHLGGGRDAVTLFES